MKFWISDMDREQCDLLIKGNENLLQIQLEVQQQLKALPQALAAALKGVSDPPGPEIRDGPVTNTR